MHRVLEQLRRQLTPRRRDVAVATFDAAAGQWRYADASGADDRDELTLTTFNIWNDPHFAAERHRAIVELMSKHGPDVMVFQEVTPDALEILLSHPWVREHCSALQSPITAWATTACFCCPECPCAASATRGCPAACRAASCRPR